MDKQKKYTQLGVRMTEEELEKLGRLARESGRSRSNVLRILLSVATSVPARVTPGQQEIR